MLESFFGSRFHMNCQIDLELSAPKILGFGQWHREAHIKNPNNKTVPEGVMQGLISDMIISME